MLTATHRIRSVALTHGTKTCQTVTSTLPSSSSFRNAACTHIPSTSQAAVRHQHSLVGLPKSLALTRADSLLARSNTPTKQGRSIGSSSPFSTLSPLLQMDHSDHEGSRAPLEDHHNHHSHSDRDSDSDSDGESPSSSSSSSSSPSSSNPRYNRQGFTPEMDQEILDSRALGLSWSLIDSKLGLPYRSCHRRYITLLNPQLSEVWPAEELARMDQLVAEGKAWKEISKVLGRSSISCQIKWNSMFKPNDSDRNRPFDALQSKVLMHLVEQYGDSDWKKIMREFMIQLGGKDMARITPEQLRHQYLKLWRKPAGKVWSLNEETALIQHVLQHGTKDWEGISKALLGNHSPEDCKVKWTGLDMSTRIPKDKAWYKAEQANFWKYWEKFGEQWELVAEHMPRRTAAHCQRFFESTTAKLDRKDPEEFKKQVKAMAETSKHYQTILWSKEDSDRLWDVAEGLKKSSKFGRTDWTEVAKIMKMNLMPNQYKHHHYYLKTRKRGGLSGTWTEQDMRTLERAVKEQGRDWVLISTKYLPHRNPKSLCHKYGAMGNRGFHISEKEYDALMAQVEIQEKEFEEGQYQQPSGSVSPPPPSSSSLSSAASSSFSSSPSSPSSPVSHPPPSSTRPTKFTPNFSLIAKNMPGVGWTEEQCRSAYEASFKNHLKNAQERWSPEEDALLLKASSKLGRKNWTGIAALIPGKHTWECRLRWAALQEPVLQTVKDLHPKTDHDLLVDGLEDAFYKAKDQLPKDKEELSQQQLRTPAATATA